MESLGNGVITQKQAKMQWVFKDSDFTESKIVYLSKNQLIKYLLLGKSFILKNILRTFGFKFIKI